MDFLWLLSIGQAGLGQVLQPRATLEIVLQNQRSQWLCWAPVWLGLGVGLYFQLGFEPDVVLLGAIGVAVLLSAVLAYGRKCGAYALLWAVAFTGAGFDLAALRSHAVAAPVLQYRYYGPVQGRVIAIDRSASGALRLTLDQVILSNMPPETLPTKIRMSLHGDQSWISPAPHQWVGLTGHLSPPSGPVEPEGFDFQRYAWFQGLGAVGYTRTPALVLDQPEHGPSLLQFRYQLAAVIQNQLPGDAGSVAAALTTGVRGGISPEIVETLRTTNLAHLLAISGLHMGLLAGVVFWTIRALLTLVSSVALRLPVKKIAAAAAIWGATGYLFVSGASIATERAYVMACVALMAVLLNRRVISLRAVAVAALILLIRRPESLLSPGFQMSFAATTALVVVFGGLRGKSLGPAWLKPVVTVFVSSSVAGAATAPIAAAHFNLWASYGLFANLLAVPVMGAVVVPAAVLAACLAPFGAAKFGLQLMELGIRWILGVAAHFASLDGARTAIVAPPSGVLTAMTLGALVLILLRGRLRWVGVAPMIIAFGVWVTYARPAVLVAETGKLVGIMSEDGRVLSRAKGQGFVAARWLENDGDLVEQSHAAARIDRAKDTPFQIDFAEGTLWHINGKRDFESFPGCKGGDIVVSAIPFDQPPDCRFFDPSTLKVSGALAVTHTKAGLEIRSVNQTRGQRLWTPPHRSLPEPLGP